jgi:L-ascorbate metabolism protein UlaG (beta-lactamase superfamily)
LSADLVLVTHNHPDHNNPAMISGNPHVAMGLDSAGKVQAVHHVLDRLPNAEKPMWRPVVDAAEPTEVRSGHEVLVTSISAWHDDRQGAERGANAMFLIEVDGLRIVHCGDLGQTRLTDDQRRAMGNVDVLILPIGGVYTVDGRQAAEIVRQVSPRTVVPIHFKTPALSFDLQPIDVFLAALKDEAEVDNAVGNTLAVSALSATSPQSPAAGSNKMKIVVLKYVPWHPPAELAELFTRMEADSRSAQEVFAKLSVTQMNYKPANGTHTPRWNAEHMMAGELRFFTQIYATRDPAVAMIDLGPAQMPADYKPAHPNWTGAEEALQITRASALVRRFAYLLDGIGIDDRIPGRRQTLRGLFALLDGHYTQHTANVKSKFSLPDWPQE